MAGNFVGLLVAANAKNSMDGRLGNEKNVEETQRATVVQSCQILKHEIHIKRALRLSEIPIEIASSLDSARESCRSSSVNISTISWKI